MILDAIRQGRPIAELKPDLPQGVRFYVLGLSPNAARLSVRFYIEDDFAEIANRYLAHVERMRLDPPPKEEAPSIWRLLIETASQRKSENIPPNLAGEWLRAILTGAPYPLTLLSTLLMRLRADHDVNALRVSILKSVLIRNFDVEAPVSLDPENNDSGYLLGRLFAALRKYSDPGARGQCQCDHYAINIMARLPRRRARSFRCCSERRRIIFRACGRTSRALRTTLTAASAKSFELAESRVAVHAYLERAASGAFRRRLLPSKK